VGGQGRVDVDSVGPGDPRAWSVGTLFKGVPASSLKLLYCSDAARPSECVAAFPAGMSMRIDVESATGGPEPYPKFVTDDFIRTFWMRFDTADATEIACSVPCSRFPLTVNVSLHLDQSAADYVYHPDAPCWVR
jgi:hypothetical protein